MAKQTLRETALHEKGRRLCISKSIERMREYSSDCIVQNINRFLQAHTTKRVVRCNLFVNELCCHSADESLIFYANAESTVMAAQFDGSVINYPIEDNAWPLQRVECTDDCLLKIAVLLSLPDLLSCRSVCSQWRSVFSYHSLWVQHISLAERLLKTPLKVLYPNEQPWTTLAQIHFITHGKIDYDYFVSLALWKNKSLLCQLVEILWLEWFDEVQAVDIERLEDIDGLATVTITFKRRTLRVRNRWIEEDGEDEGAYITYWTNAIQNYLKSD